MNSSLALFEVYRIGWQVPVDHGVAVGVEVQPLLANGRGNEHEWPERRVEGFSNVGGPGDLAPVLGPLITESKCEASAHSPPGEGHPLSSLIYFKVVGEQGGGAERQSAAYRPGDPFGDFIGSLAREPEGLAKDVRVLVQRGL